MQSSSAHPPRGPSLSAGMADALPSPEGPRDRALVLWMPRGGGIPSGRPRGTGLSRRTRDGECTRRRELRSAETGLVNFSPRPDASGGPESIPQVASPSPGLTGPSPARSWARDKWTFPCPLMLPPGSGRGPALVLSTLAHVCRLSSSPSSARRRVPSSRSSALGVSQSLRPCHSFPLHVSSLSRLSHLLLTPPNSWSGLHPPSSRPSRPPVAQPRPQTPGKAHGSLPLPDSHGPVPCRVPAQVRVPSLPSTHGTHLRAILPLTAHPGPSRRPLDPLHPPLCQQRR